MCREKHAAPLTTKKEITFLQDKIPLLLPQWFNYHRSDHTIWYLLAGTNRTNQLNDDRSGGGCKVWDARCLWLWNVSVWYAGGELSISQMSLSVGHCSRCSECALGRLSASLYPPASLTQCQYKSFHNDIDMTINSFTLDAWQSLHRYTHARGIHGVHQSIQYRWLVEWRLASFKFNSSHKH